MFKAQMPVDAALSCMQGLHAGLQEDGLFLQIADARYTRRIYPDF